MTIGIQTYTVQQLQLISAQLVVNVNLDMSEIVRVIAYYQVLVQPNGVDTMHFGQHVAVLLAKQLVINQTRKLV